MRRVYNFSAGPATLPLEVLKQAQEELLDWQGRGMSIMEMSHRNQDFVDLSTSITADFRELLAIPKSHHIIFVQGGGRGQFSMVPLNLLGAHKGADYFESGLWSLLSIQEAGRYCNVNVAASGRGTDYTTIPARADWRCQDDSAYFHYVDNETVHGIEFPDVPDVSVPLVCDMSSNILSRPIDFSKFGLIYAGMQKNIGPAGLAIVVVREDLLGHALPITPHALNYKTHVDSGSLYVTPPTFVWYLAGLVFKWVKKEGGVAAMAERSELKSKKLYEYIDRSPFYHCPVDPHYRSRMNVVFDLKNQQRETDFLMQAEAAGLSQLKGHKFRGGMRASLYNAMPEAGVDALIEFMQHFEVTQA